MVERVRTIFLAVDGVYGVRSSPIFRVTWRILRHQGSSDVYGA